MTWSPAVAEARGNYTVYFRDSEESLRCLSPSCPERVGGTRVVHPLGIAVVAIHAQAGLLAPSR